MFCSVACFERHLPTARHKDAAAIESLSPKAQSVPAAMSATATEPTRRIISGPPGAGSAQSLASSGPKEVLIIASRLKEYIQARGEMNTSANVMDVLSDYIRVVADRAIENARADGRKTVLDRDFQFLKK